MSMSMCNAFGLDFALFAYFALRTVAIASRVELIQTTRILLRSTHLNSTRIVSSRSTQLCRSPRLAMQRHATFSMSLSLLILALTLCMLQLTCVSVSVSATFEVNVGDAQTAIVAGAGEKSTSKSFVPWRRWHLHRAHGDRPHAHAQTNSHAVASKPTMLTESLVSRDSPHVDDDADDDDDSHALPTTSRSTVRVKPKSSHVSKSDQRHTDKSIELGQLSRQRTYDLIVLHHDIAFLNATIHAFAVESDKWLATSSQASSDLTDLTTRLIAQYSGGKKKDRVTGASTRSSL